MIDGVRTGHIIDEWTKLLIMFIVSLDDRKLTESLNPQLLRERRSLCDVYEFQERTTDYGDCGNSRIRLKNAFPNDLSIGKIEPTNCASSRVDGVGTRVGCRHETRNKQYRVVTAAMTAVSAARAGRTRNARGLLDCARRRVRRRTFITPVLSPRTTCEPCPDAANLSSSARSRQGSLGKFACDSRPSPSGGVSRRAAAERAVRWIHRRPVKRNESGRKKKPNKKARRKRTNDKKKAKPAGCDRERARASLDICRR